MRYIIYKYSGDLKSDHLKSGLLEVTFQMVLFENGWALAMAIALVLSIHKPDHLKSGQFCLNFK